MPERGALRDIAGFGACTRAERAALVPFGHGVFNEVDPVAQRARFDVHPPGAPAPSWRFDTYDRYLPSARPTSLNVMTGIGFAQTHRGGR